MILWHDLLPNLAVVAIATALWTLGRRHTDFLPRWQRAALFSVVMTLGVLGTMAIPIQLFPGVFLDARYTFLAIAGYFGGPGGAALPLIVALLRRFANGGTGVMIGIPQIIAASLGGIGFHYLYRGQLATMRGVALVAVWAAVSGIAGFYYWFPVSRWVEITVEMTGPLAAVLLLSTLLSGLAIVEELRRHVVTLENRLYRSVIEALPDCLNAKDANGRFLIANPATAELMGTDVSGLIGRTDAEFYDVETAAEFRKPELEVLETGNPITIEQRFTRRNGTAAWLSTQKAPLHDDFGKLVGVITHNREITDRKQLEQELERSQRRLSDAIESMSDGIAVFDEHGIVLFHNRRYQELFPLTADVRVAGNCLRNIIRASLVRGEEPEAKGNVDDIVERLAHVLTRPGDRIESLSDGRWIEARTRMTGEGGFLINYSDVTAHRQREERLHKLNSKLTALANTDALTGLPNRRAFDVALDTAATHASTHGASLSVLMVDVDRFKAYNDNYGHLAGDVCLQQVSVAIANVFRSVGGAVTARYGGEESPLSCP